MKDLIVTPQDLIKAKVEILKMMNKIILNMTDERYYYTWIVTGVPDEPTEDDFEIIAEDKERWKEVLELFGKLTADNEMELFD